MAEDLESSTATAWEEFERRLLERLEELEDGETLLLEVPQDEDKPGAAPYVQFCAWGEDMVRCEAVSNHYLLDSWALSEEAGEELVGLGFSAPTYAPGETEDSGSSNYFVDVPREETADLGWMTVGALRDVYGVPHPMLLEADGIVDPAPEDEEPVMSTEHDCDPEALEARVPQGPAELQSLVDAALEADLGHPPHKDEDGDIPIKTEESVVWVRVVQSTPAVDVFGIAFGRAPERELARHEVAVLNRDNVEVKFVLREGSIVAQMRVNALPFVAAHLRQAVDTVCTAVDRAHEDLAPRFRAAAPHDEDDE
jgi:hypothetical protein